MKKFILVLFLFFSIGVMAIHVHHFPHHIYHHSSPRQHSHVTTQTRNVCSIPHRNTKVINTVWRNGILYYVILNPRRGHAYGDKWVLCEGCKKMLVKKGIKYCSKCRKINKPK